MTTPRGSWPVRVALACVPRGWRDSVREDLGEDAGGGAAIEALAVGIGLHWTFTGAALLSDIRYAVRSMRRARAFALGAVCTFALGIGVNVAVFSTVDRMLFRPLPYAQAGDLVVLGEYAAGANQPYGTVPTSYTVGVRQLPAFLDATISTWNPESYRLTENPDGAGYLTFVQVAYNMLRVLGVHPVFGRDFTIDDARGTEHKVLISYGVWRREFDSHADVLGRRVWSAEAGQTAEIIGVLPEDFIPPQISIPNLSWSGLSVTGDTLVDAAAGNNRPTPPHEPADAHLRADLDPAAPNDRSTPPIVRLKPGMSLDAATAEVHAMVLRLQPPGRPSGPASPTAIRLVPLRDALFGRYQLYVGLVFGAATLVLLVACANLASLLLVRARSREHLAAVQLALGASSGRVVQTAVIEALLLAAGGSALALVVLRLGNHAMAAWLPPLFSKYAAPVFATRVLVFSTALATLSAVVAGVLPGLRSSRVDVLAVLQRGAARVSAGKLGGSDGLLAAEVAVSLVLVACATLASRSLIGLLDTDVGFAKDHLESVTPVLPASLDATARFQQYSGMLEILRSMPGVKSAAAADILPVVGAYASRAMWNGGRNNGERWAITDNFVETMGMRLVAGRTISAADVQTQAPVGLLSESGVTLVWPATAPRDAVGKFLDFPGETPRQVIGVVSDVRSGYGRTPAPSLYVPISAAGFRLMMLVARTIPPHPFDLTTFSHRLKEQGYRPTRISSSPIADRFDAGVADPRFRAELFSSFGVIGLVLALVGLYAVQSFTVALREREFGVRLSLGATPSDLWRMLVRQTLRPVLIGIAVGLVITYWAGQFLQPFLERANARDPWTYAAVVASLIAVNVFAAWLPARRAARVDPAVVLRAQ